jgi:hypothetical protein
MLTHSTGAPVSDHEIGEIEELLAKRRWTEHQFKLLADFLSYTDYERQQALWAVPIEALLARSGINFPTGKQTPQIHCFLPEHSDRTASMTLYRRTNSCYCFGCRHRLNTIDVLMKFDGLSYGQAMDYLLGECLQTTAELLRRRIRERFRELRSNRQKVSLAAAGPPTPSTTTSLTAFTIEPDIQTIQVEAGRDFTAELAERYHEVQSLLTATVEFYALQLAGNSQAQQYLFGRGLTAATIENFRLGFACGIGLSGWLRNQGLDLQLAALLGILGKNGKGERLAGRITVPVFDRENQVVQITGRVFEGGGSPTFWLEEETVEEPAEEEPANGVANVPAPKYLHLRLPKPHFSRFLPPTGKLPYLLLVEGPFDYLLARQWNYPAVCNFGTNVNYDNLTCLKEALDAGKLDQLLIGFDNDPDKVLADGSRTPGPGPQAAHKLLAEFKSERVSFLQLPPDFKDIASLGETSEGELQLARAIKTVLQN